MVYDRKRFIYGRIRSVSGDRIQSPGQKAVFSLRMERTEKRSYCHLIGATDILIQ